MTHVFVKHRHILAEHKERALHLRVLLCRIRRSKRRLKKFRNELRTHFTPLIVFIGRGCAMQL